MLPVLLTVGPLTLRTLSVFLLGAVLVFAFVYWKKITEEHYDEVAAFDGWIIAGIAGVIGARIGGFVWQWLSLADLTGWYSAWGAVRYDVMTGMLFGGWVLMQFAARQKWDVWEVLDYWVLGMSLAWAITWLGLFFDGTSLGTPTKLPWGILFPGIFQPVHPVQLYMASIFFGIFGYLSWAEYHYRAFSWYRSGKNSAQSGFLSAVFVLATGVISLLMSMIRPPQLFIGSVAVDVVFYIAMVVLGVWMLIRRSGRTLALPTLGKHRV